MVRCANWNSEQMEIFVCEWRKTSGKRRNCIVIVDKIDAEKAVNFGRLLPSRPSLKSYFVLSFSIYRSTSEIYFHFFFCRRFLYLCVLPPVYLSIFILCSLDCLLANTTRHTVWRQQLMFNFVFFDVHSIRLCILHNVSSLSWCWCLWLHMVIDTRWAWGMVCPTFFRLKTTDITHTQYQHLHSIDQQYATGWHEKPIFLNVVRVMFFWVESWIWKSVRKKMLLSPHVDSSSPLTFEDEWHYTYLMLPPPIHSSTICWILVPATGWHGKPISSVVRFMLCWVVSWIWESVRKKMLLSPLTSHIASARVHSSLPVTL